MGWIRNEGKGHRRKLALEMLQKPGADTEEDNELLRKGDRPGLGTVCELPCLRITGNQCNGGFHYLLQSSFSKTNDVGQRLE